LEAKETSVWKQTGQENICTYAASVSADETLKLWRCFTPTSTKNKETTDFESIPTCYKPKR
jgi:WD40 repeat protein